MGKKQIQKSLNTFTARIKKSFKPEKVILFGSFACNNASDYSDVDILVVANKFAEIPLENRLDSLYDFTRDLRPDFHVYGVTPDEYNQASPLTIIAEIKQQGIDLV